MIRRIKLDVSKLYFYIPELKESWDILNLDLQNGNLIITMNGIIRGASLSDGEIIYKEKVKEED